MTTPIQATDRISAILKRDESLVEVLISASSTFKKLKNPLMRRTMAKLVTVEQAAQIAGLDPEALVARLNQAIGASGGDASAAAASAPPPQPARAPLPPELAALPEDALLECDVREDLRNGQEPFQRIMGAVRDLAPGQVLRLWATFEPVPLYAVLAKRGLGHFTEQLDQETWRVWFFPSEDARGTAAGAPPAGSPAEGEDDMVVIDVRGLEPPEPMMRTLEALEQLPRGKTLIQLNVRVPQFLIPKLEERGFTYEVREQSADLVRLFIRHKA
ncbi:MAG: DUF2249 domain-containing protein [Sorangiineae bacterium]|nr:DUF2249 domain-containing protein [Polyangiaceae bacterium]MEB2323642.1 DUF2249 domain-containing protein [Sorangiineae bacterium]